VLFDESPPIVFYEDLTLKNPNKKLYEGARNFQNTWSTKLPWVKFIIDDESLMHQVKG
jgi:hypothetical protein